MLAPLALYGCSKTAQITVDQVPVKFQQPPPKAVLPPPSPLRLQPVKWTVITPDRLPPGKNWVFVALTPQGYEALSKNIAEFERWMTEAVYRLNYYAKDATDVRHQ